MRRLLPQGLAGRLALLLAVALIMANVVAVALLSLERDRLIREAREARHVERIVALVPVIETVDPRLRAAIARDASNKFTRVTVDRAPAIGATSADAASRELGADLASLLPGRLVHAAIFSRYDPKHLDRDGRGPDGREGASDDTREHGHRPPDLAGRPNREIFVVSVGLGDGAWLNLLSTAPDRPRKGVFGGAFLLILTASLIAVLGVALLFMRRLTRPLGELAEAARAAGRGDRTRRLPETGAREMREAAAAFNDMQARIARFDAERMRTLAAVGHDLRTPLTSLRIRAEMLDEAEAEPVIRTLDEMTVMADGLIAYARGAEEVETAEPIALWPFLERICADRGASLGASLGEGPDVTVKGRPVALGRAVGNLIDNAIRYGGSASVTLAGTGDQAEIRVEDEGPGIPAERLASVFEPFVRGDDSRNADTGGAGLGLSIARSIVLAHGGEIRLENRAGQGLRATIALPLRG